jgi:hypothetical protein
MIRALLATCAAALLSVAPLPAQHQDLGSVLDSLAVLWARGDASGLAAYGASRGIDLEVHGENLGRVSGRKAAAALRYVFASHETISVRANTSSRPAGGDQTAFAELRWEVRPRGSAVHARNTVFLGLVRENRGWQVSQIRILR